jgi:pimeloyl-ACP methyl ester carboxylesterase
MTEKETIILIHGAFTNCADWKQIASDLDQSFHVLTPDLPGHEDAAETGFTMGVKQPIQYTCSSKALQQAERP